MTREADNPMTGCDFDWIVSNHAVWGWKAPVKASVSGVSLLQLSPFFASIFPLFPQKRLILRLTISQISFVKGQRMVFTSCQNSWTHFRFYYQTFAGQLSPLLKDFSTDLFGVGINQK